MTIATTLAKNFSIAIAGGMACLSALTVSSSDVEAAAFVNRSTWESEVTPSEIFTEDFDSLPLGTFPAGTTNLGSIAVTVNGSNMFTRIADQGLINGSNEFQAFIIQDSPTIGNVTSITFDFGINVIGFGADFLSALTGDLLTVSTGANTYEFDNFLGFPGDGFFGIVEDTVFSSITFNVENLTNFGEWFTLDNLVFARAISVSVPEPNSGLGILVFGAASAIALLKRKGGSSK